MDRRGYWTLTLALVWWTPWVEILWSFTVAVGSLAGVVSRRASAAAAIEATEVEPAEIEPAEQ